MMTRLVGRKTELARLEKAWNSGDFEFVVLYGRRRVGKSFLLDCFAQGKACASFEAVDKGSPETQLTLMSRVVALALYGTETLKYPDFISIFDDIARKAEKERFLFIIDEASYLCEACPEIIGLLQHYVDVVFPRTKLVLILSGSSRRFIEENVLSSQSPLYGRRTVEVKLLPFMPEETAQMLQGWTFDDIAGAHVITGGVPYYLHFLGRHSNLADAIHDEFFMAGSSLFTEARLFFMGLFRNVATYDSILGQLASGTNEVGKIAGKCALGDANVSNAFTILATHGIVSRRCQIAGRGVAKGWEFSDGYFAFYYRYVHPYRSMIERDRGDAAFQNAMASLGSFVAKGIEGAFRDHVLMHSNLLIKSIGSIDFPNPVLKRNEEIDLFGQTDDGWIVGECKWRDSPVRRDVYNLLEMRKLLLVGEEKADYFILSRSGFDEDVLALAKSREDIHLITGRELFCLT